LKIEDGKLKIGQRKLPTGWEVKKLRDVCEFEKTPKKQNQLPYVGLENIESNTGLFIGSYESVDVKSLTFQFDNSHILYGRLRPYLNKVLKPDFAGHCSTEIFPIKPFKSIDRNYLFHWFLSDSTVNKINATCTGARMPRADMNEVLDFTIPIPPLPEQKRIVAILDEAFDAVGKAKANAEKNLANARELFESYLQSVFENKGEGPASAELWRDKWEEKRLGEVGETQTGTTPKTSDKENYGNYIPFITPADIDILGDGRIRYRDEGLSERGLKNGREMKKDSILMVCIGASIGKVGFIDRNVSCNQQINSLTVKKGFYPKFFYYALRTKKFFEQVMKSSAQATLPIINKGKWKKLSIDYPDSIDEQKGIVSKLDGLSAETKKLEAIYKKRIADLEELKKSVLQKAFKGELTADTPIQLVSNTVSFPEKLTNINTTDLHAGILAISYKMHENNNKTANFCHVKAEKIAHMIEAFAGIDLGRIPVKDAAGPNDFRHLKKVEHRARMINCFDFQRTAGGAYRVCKLRNFERLIEKTRTALGEHLTKVEHILDLMLPLNVQHAEIVATVFAAWNNLLLDGKQPTDEEIVYEARENWHPDKLKIERDKFFKTIEWMRKKNIVPNGKGKRVTEKAA